MLLYGLKKKILHWIHVVGLVSSVSHCLCFELRDSLVALVNCFVTRLFTGLVQTSLCCHGSPMKSNHGKTLKLDDNVMGVSYL